MNTQRTLQTAGFALAVLLISTATLRAGEIHNAVARGDVAEVEKLIAASPEVVNEKALVKNEEEGWSMEGAPLHIAAMYCHKDLAKLLLDKGADVNARDETDFTPLHLAAWKGDTSVAEVLLAKGAKVGLVNNDKNTPLHLAAEGAPFGEVPSSEQKTAMVKLLLEKGADPNAKNSKGATPLHVAAAKGLKDAVKMLVEKGANVKAKDGNGKTALELARDEGHTEIVELLQKAAAK